MKKAISSSVVSGSRGRSDIESGIGFLEFGLLEVLDDDALTRKPDLGLEALENRAVVNF